MQIKMSSKQWLLVEWVDESSTFPSYDVVSADSLINEDKELYQGKMIFVRTKHGNSAQRAQILRISDDKQHVKEHKLLLERRDHQVRNMLSMCMRTIKEIKTDPLLYSPVNSNSQINVGAGASTSKINNYSSSDQQLDSSNSNDSDGEAHNETPQFKRSKVPVKTAAELKRMTNIYNNERSRSSNVKAHNRKRPLMSSTPLHKTKTENVELPKLKVDKGTDTDICSNTHVLVPIQKIELMERNLHELYSRFLNLISRMQLNYENDNSDEQNGAVASDTESNEQNAESGRRSVSNNSTLGAKDTKHNANSKSLEVRRMSAHTTNNIEQSFAVDYDMVPIGLGNATVPARVINDINWDSYSSATRQLLQAVFPRKVLATHSLTGKKSPAFANLPAKKCLNPKLIDDIVDTVSERCGVPKRLVRGCITIKCTDEAKLYRNRVRGRVPRAPGNQENVPPQSPSPVTSHSSNES